MASNYTLDGFERKGMDSGSSNFDPDTVMDSKLVPDSAPSEEQQAEPIMVNPDLFSYEETHKVLKDGRIVQRDPVTGKWSKRPAGIANDIWERLPHSRHHLQLVGPELFTDEELRGVDSTPKLGEVIVDPSVVEDVPGLEDADTYESGTLSTSMGHEDISQDGISISGTDIVQ